MTGTVGQRVLRTLLCFFTAGLCASCAPKVSLDIESGEWFVARLASRSYKVDAVQWMLQESYPDFVSLLNDTPAKRVTVDVISYRTVDPQGRPVVASGVVVYPTDIPVRGTVLSLHGTILSAAEAPSRNILQPGALFAFQGYAVVIPDLIGFGETIQMNHPYLHAENTGRVAADMVLASREYFSRLAVETPGPFYAEGYSQGGHGALAFLKYVQERGLNALMPAKVYAGGGPYDLTGTFDHFVQTDYSSFPWSRPYAVMGMVCDEKQRVDLTQVFRGELLYNLYDWFGASKKYHAGQVNEWLGTTVSGFMHEDFFRPERNASINKLYNAFAANSLIDWSPQVPVVLFHAAGDTVVPFLNAENAFEAFKARGCAVQLRSTGGEGYDHADMMVDYYAEIYEELK